MEVLVKFAGGPIDGQSAYTDGLDQAKIFFDARERRAMLYVRIDELVYAYDHIRSVKLTDNYEKTVAHFDAKRASSLRFTEQEGSEIHE